MKRQPMYKRYANNKPMGTYTLTNCFGLVVFEPDEIDKYDCELVCAWWSTEGMYGFHKHMIHYTALGRGFIRKGGTRIYLDEVMRDAG